MKTRLSTLFLILLITGVNAVNAQKKFEWSINIGGSFPVGAFSKINYNSTNLSSDCGLFDENVNGGASVGFNVGAEVILPLKNENFSFFLSADLHYNGIKSDAKAYLTDMCNYLASLWGQQLIDAGEYLQSSTCTLDRTPAYINIPILAGVRYSFDISDGMKLFAEAEVGLNIRKITSWQLTGTQKYIFSDYSEDTWLKNVETFSYETSSTFAFKIGAGIHLTEDILLSANYYYLGAGDVSAKLTAETSAEYVSPSTASQYLKLKTINPTMFVVKIGYAF